MFTLIPDRRNLKVYAKASVLFFFSMATILLGKNAGLLQNWFLSRKEQASSDLIPGADVEESSSFNNALTAGIQADYFAQASDGLENQIFLFNEDVKFSELTLSEFSATQDNIEETVFPQSLSPTIKTEPRFQLMGGMLGRYNSSSSFGFKLGMINNYVYLVDNTSGLQIINVQDPLNPNLVGSEFFLPLRSKAALTVTGNYAYVTDELNICNSMYCFPSYNCPSALHVVDVSDPSRPYQIGAIGEFSGAVSASNGGNFAYANGDCASGYGVLRSIGFISHNPLETFSYSSSISIGNQLGISIAEHYGHNYTFIFSKNTYSLCQADLLIVDIADPSNLRLMFDYKITSYNYPAYQCRVTTGPYGGSYPLGIAVTAATMNQFYSYVYIADGAAGFQVIQFNPAEPPLLVGNSSSIAPARAITLSGNYAYVANDVGLQIVDISNPINPFLAKSFAISGVANDVAVSGNVAYVLTSNSLQIIQFGNGPILINNNLAIINGQTHILTSNDLSAVDPGPGQGPNQIVFTVSNVQHLQFEFIANPGVAIYQFTFQNILNGDVQVTHDGSDSAPSYQVSISDGLGQTQPATASISFTLGSSIISQTPLIAGLAGGGGGALLLCGVGIFAVRRHCKNRQTSISENDIEMGSSQNKKSVPAEQKDQDYSNPISTSVMQSTALIGNSESSGLDAEKSFDALTLIPHDNIKYDIELGKRRILGQGSSGIVYKAIYQRNDVAVKQLKNNESIALNEFLHEARIMGRLRPNNIVHCYGYCIKPKYSLILKYMSKGSLCDVLHNKNEILPLDRQIKIITNIASGINYLHSQKIIHGDLKSKNIFIDADYTAYVGDFGLAQVGKRRQNQQGTPRWTAPEIFAGKPCTKQSDVYSMGYTMWEVFSRKLPLQSHRDNDPKSIAEFVTRGERDQIPVDCPKTVANLIRRCWDTDPTKRPSAEQVLNDLAEENDQGLTQQNETRTQRP